MYKFLISVAILLSYCFLVVFLTWNPYFILVSAYSREPYHNRLDSSFSTPLLPVLELIRADWYRSLYFRIIVLEVFLEVFLQKSLQYRVFKIHISVTSKLTMISFSAKMPSNSASYEHGGHSMEQWCPQTGQIYDGNPSKVGLNIEIFFTTNYCYLVSF